jgi:uncharacterized membrane protein
LRASSLIDSVGDDTRKLIVELYPLELPERAPADDVPEGAPPALVAAPKPGVLFKVAEDELVEVAERNDVCVVLRPRIGDFVPEGATVFAVYGRRPVDAGDLLSGVVFGKDRTLHADVAYGIRMLVDVAVRSLSSAMGDATTAVQAMDRIHDCLRMLVTRPFPTGRHAGASGRLRLVVPALSWEGYVHVALDELRHLSVNSIQATRRLSAMLEDLIAVAPPKRQPPLRHQLALLDTMVEHRFAETGEAAWALEPDQQGVGSGRSEILQRVAGT